ncbi:MAG: hypothetical protein IPM74_07685 [Crocinitomicaceae bacterium]|nr:hypothetical protein [Crocinitomicaceae bacterium]MBK8925781.1 hypothetical protein [Crocinitomicaceae bacterium]
MRLGQLARKLDTKPSAIIEYVKTNYGLTLENDLNTRVEDEHAQAFAKSVHVNISALTEETESTTTEPKLESTTAKELTEKESEVIESTPESIHVPIEVPHYHSATHEKNESVVDPFIPLPVDPEAELIKAPKIKLEGLKVLGKIELPEAKKEIQPEDESGEASVKKRGSKFAEINVAEDDEENSIYKDKNGIYHFSQTQRENRKNSLERIKKEKQEQLRKQKQVKHYKQATQSDKKTVSKKKETNKNQKSTNATKPIRKGLWGKFLNWLND